MKKSKKLLSEQRFLKKDNWKRREDEGTPPENSIPRVQIRAGCQNKRLGPLNLVEGAGGQKKKGKGKGNSIHCTHHTKNHPAGQAIQTKTKDLV